MVVVVEGDWLVLLVDCVGLVEGLGLCGSLCVLCLFYGYDVFFKEIDCIDVIFVNVICFLGEIV